MEDKRMDCLDEMLKITDEIIRLWKKLGIKIEDDDFENTTKSSEEQEEKKGNSEK